MRQQRPRETRPEIAARLKRLRIALGLTQTEMAQALQLASHQAWGNYETGKRLLPYEVALDLVHLWGVSLDWTYRGVPDMLPLKLALDHLGEAASACSIRA